MEETIIHPPRTIMEVFKMLPEGTLAEVIDNRLYMSPSPIGKHQHLLTKLTIQLGNFIFANKLGDLYVAPFDVFLDEEENAVQPDIIFVTSQNKEIVDNEGVIHGVPDLLVEILSPGNPKYDKQIKKDLYERFGVKEYWIVDPSTLETIGYTHSGGKFQKIDSTPGKINSILLNHSFEF